MVLMVLPSMGGAQESGAKPVGASVTGWMAELKAGFEKAYRERVVDVYAAGLEVARREYAEQLQLALKEAERAGDRQTAVVFRQESERVAEESWRMPPDDQDTSMAVLRRARQIYREQVSELNRAWDEASRKLVSEFESTLVQGARQLTAKNLEREVRRVLECRQELVAVWLPRMWEIHRGTRLSVPERGDGEPGAGGEPTGKLPAVSRKELEEAVKWVLGGGGRIHVRRNGHVQLLEKVGDLPTGKVDFWSVSFNGEKFGQAPTPGELGRLGQFRSVRQLYLGGFDLAPTDWSFLAGLRQLEVLHFTGARLDSSAAAWIARCKDLQTLELMDCEGLTADFFRVLAAGVPGLKALRLSGSQVPDTAGMELGRLERLESLWVDAPGLTPAVLPSWAGIRSLRSLILFGGTWPREVLEVLRRHPIEKLGFVDSDHAGFPEQLALIGELFPKLRNLEIRGKCLSVDHALALAENLRNLEVLNLQWVDLNVGAAKALARLPHLRVLTCRAAGLGDEVFQELLAIRSLQELDVLGTQVSDHSTEAICRAGLNGLRALNVAGTRISKGAAASVERRGKGLKVRTVASEIGLVR
jgi:hypothetical protein